MDNSETYPVPELAEGWEWSQIGQICQHPQYGWTTSGKTGAGGLKLLRTTDISSGQIDWDKVPVCKDEPKEAQNYLLNSGDILISRAGSVGINCLIQNCPEAIFASYLIRLRPIKPISSEYLHFFLNSPDYWSAISDNTAGITIPNVNASKLSAISIPIPPLAEQDRIVSKVDELLAGVNSARERLARVPGILKRFRQSLLAAACSGRLTADWRAGQTNLKPPLTRDDSIQDALDEMPENWRSTTMRKLTTTITSGSRGWAKYYCDKGAIFIRSHDINTDNLQLENVAHVNPPLGAEGRRTQVNSGDLLITITGANVTRAALVRGEIPEAYISQHVSLVRLSNIEWGRFLYLWIISPTHGRKQLLDAAYGAGKPGLNLDNIRDMLVALPPITEQQEIVRRVEALFQLADAIEARVAVATTRADRLTQAILAKAFRGELVPTEAELARREGRNFEPAAVLLARLQEERRLTTEAQPRRQTLKGRKRKTAGT